MIEDLFRPLVGSLPFDDILLASENGEIVYRSKKNGPRVHHAGRTAREPDRQRTRRNPPANPAGTAPKADPVSIHLTDVVLTGTSYKLFLQPVLIDAFSDDPSQPEERHTWMLCGLRSSATLEWEALAISYTVIIWLTVVLFAVCMGGPILKLFLMNHRERLRLRELGFLGLFLILLSGIFTLSGLQAAYFHSNDDDTEGRLKQLGENLASGHPSRVGAHARPVTGDVPDRSAQTRSSLGNYQREDQARVRQTSQPVRRRPRPPKSCRQVV